MANPSKRRGTYGENRILRFFRPWFPRAERRALHGTNDKGDLVNVGGFTISCKFQKQLRLQEWMRELETQMKNDSNKLGILGVVHAHHGISFHMNQETMTWMLDAIYGRRSDA